MSSAATASAAPAADAVVPNKLGLTLDEDSGVPTGRNKTPCATPKGYRAIALDITPTSWKADLSKCNVCDDKFTWLNHRHKCRNCQRAVCNSCSKSRKVLRAHTAPKRVCNSCIQSCWTPRDAKDPAAATSAAKADAAKGKDGRRVSLTVSTSDANACETDATATAPLSPGTPAAAGFFPGMVTPSAATSSTPVAGGSGVRKQSTGDRSTAASTGRGHRRQASAAMPPPPPLASPTSLSTPAASTMPPPPPPAMPALAPPTPAGDDDEAQGEGHRTSGTPSSVSIGRGDAGADGSAETGPFFGGRPRSRRESSGGRLEGSGRWSGVVVGGALGGGIFGNGYIHDVDMGVEGEDGHQVEEIRAEQQQQQQQQQQQASSSTRPATLPVLPEEVSEATSAPDNDPTEQQQKQESEEDELDDGEGGPMMMKISGWSGVVLGAVAVGSGVAVAVVVRSAFSLVFFS